MRIMSPNLDGRRTFCDSRGASGNAFESNGFVDLAPKSPIGTAFLRKASKSVGFGPFSASVCVTTRFERCHSYSGSSASGEVSL